MFSLSVTGCRSFAAAPANGAIEVLADRFDDDWRRFRHRYTTADGRVVDTGNGGVSHSEGQGYGMLFAVAAGDRASFEQIRAWTRDHLERDDGLHYWRYDPRSSPRVTDPNAAADGELLIAWALLRAAARWEDMTAAADAQRILDAFEDRLVRRIGPRLVIIPWDGADLDSPRVINLSYFVFPALQDVAVFMPAGRWVELYEDCLDLVRDARFGDWKLPPDWLAIDDDNELSLWRERKPYFSYDAIRVPLHLVWAGHDSDAFLRPFLAAWRDLPLERTPAWFNLMPMGGARSKESGPIGFRAVRTLTENLHAAANPSKKTPPRRPLPDVYAAQDYYSASLVLLSRLAELDWWRSALARASPSANGP